MAKKRQTTVGERRRAATEPKTQRRGASQAGAYLKKLSSPVREHFAPRPTCRRS